MTINETAQILEALARLDGNKVDWEAIADAMRDATEDADDWLSAYGRAIYVGDEQIGTVDELPWSYDIAAADDDTARTILAAAIAEMAEDVLDEEDVRDVVDDLLAFLRDAKTIHGHLTEAADAVERGSADEAIVALRHADAAESDHGDTPSTSGVAAAIYESADDASE